MTISTSMRQCEANRDRRTVASTTAADYTYDGLERMAVRTTQNMSPAGTTHYLYDLQGHLIVEADDTGQTLREYVWLDDMPLAVVSDVDTATPALYFVHADHLDTPLRMTDGSKSVVWDAYYLPFGEALSITGPASNNLRFPGQYFLIESGLHYNWHRHYDPTIGRYGQADDQIGSSIVPFLKEEQRNALRLGIEISSSAAPPILDDVAPDRHRLSPVFEGIESIGFGDGPSLYSYVRSSPLTSSDPAGLQLRILGPSSGVWYGSGRLCGIICGNYQFRIDIAPNPSGSLLHFHCGMMGSPGLDLHRPWYAPWRGY